MPTLIHLQLIPRKLGITEFDSLSTLKNELPRCNCELKIDYCSTDGQLSVVLSATTYRFTQIWQFESETQPDLDGIGHKLPGSHQQSDKPGAA